MQLPPKASSPEDGAARLADAADREAKVGADLIVFPEFASTLHVADWSNDPARLASQAEPVPGPTTEAIAVVAAAQGVHVITGVLERVADGAVRDTAVLLDASGSLAGVYARTHLRSSEGAVLERGDEIGLFQTELGTIAVSVGYDLMFPELARAQALEGAEIVVTLAACDDGGDGEVEDSLVLQCRSRATENFVYFIGCNAGLGSKEDGHGSRSVIASCNGELLAAASGRGEEVVRGTLTERSFREQRMYLTIFRDRRPEAYGLLVEGSDEVMKREGVPS